VFELFANPLLLGGVALASAPFIIHLLNKRRYQIHHWAAMDFLLAAMVSNRRRVKFEDLILLLLRMAVILLLVLAVARPILRGLAGWREDERIVVLDDSFSLDVVGPTGPVFELAKEGAISQVRDAVGGSVPVSVWLGSDPRDVAGAIRTPIEGGVVDDASGDPDDDPGLSSALVGEQVLETLRDAKTVDLPLRFADIVRRVIEQAADDEAPRVRSIVLVSDFRAVDWIDDDGSLKDSLRVVFEELEREELEDRIRLQLVDVGLPLAENIAVTDVRIEDSPVLAGVPIRISVEVSNFGEEPRVAVTGDVEIARPTADTKEPAHSIPMPTIDTIRAGESIRVEVQHVFDSGGEYPITARVEGVRLTRDNESYFLAVVRDALEAVVVDGAPDPDRFLSESGMLLAALRPRGDVPSGVETTLLARELTAEDLRDADTVFILNRGEISLAERDVLADFVGHGGGVGWFLGTNVRADSYRELWEPDPGDEDPTILFPAALRAPREAGVSAAPTRMTFDDLEHPALSPFRGMRKLPIDHVLFRRFFHLDPLRASRVLAHFDDELSTPAIIESVAVSDSEDEERGGEGRRRRAGRIVVFNTSADRDWSDWPPDATYPILMQEWVRHLSRPGGSGRMREMGEPLDVPDRPGMTHSVRFPDGETVDVRRYLRRRTGTEEGGDVDDSELPRQIEPRLAGFYRVEGKPREDAVVEVSSESSSDPGSELKPRAMSEWFAFRRRSAESDLEPLGEERLRKALEPAGVQFAIGSDVEVDAFRRQQEGEIWRWMAFGAGLFLLLELFAAWWFGRRS